MDEDDFIELIKYICSSVATACERKLSDTALGKIVNHAKEVVRRSKDKDMPPPPKHRIRSSTPNLSISDKSNTHHQSVVSNSDTSAKVQK